MLECCLRILEDLIAFPTVSADSNLEITAYLAELFEEAGAKVEVIHDAGGKKANLWATMGPDVEGGAILSGHTDVVPVADQNWSSDPFQMRVHDGRLYGRGTCDMKGFVAACAAAAPMLAEHATSRPIHFAFTYDEEVGCFGALHLAEFLRRKGVRPRLAIVGEPTNMRVIEGHKGCYEYTTRFYGLEGHGSKPEKGVNAVEYAAQFAARLMELRDQLRDQAPATGRFDPRWTTLNIGALHGGNVHNIIAPAAEVAWEMRPVQQSDAEFVKSTMQDYCDAVLIPAMRNVHPAARIETDIIGEVAGLVPNDQNIARQVAMELTGSNGADVVAFGTEAGIFQSLDMDVVVCGPGSIEQAHKADEFVSVEQMAQCMSFLERLGPTLNKLPL